MTCFSAARSVIRSARSRSAVASRLINGGRSKPAPSSPFRIPKQNMNQNPLSNRTFRLPVEMSCCCVESMLPYHTATASALLTSMLSISRRSYGWTPEGQDKTR
ncbi:protein NUCLEAR FUSION DEFECTIVE 6, mitochondrial isoform X1 [Ziziphus jujuba]|uniref:Protein NUCLEAR FUSION DEFECTIVE 6, mitochondrial isoform X1 n=1 Tax=Ziziphus jujuba TaxID=326968 RepID=A0ABM3IA46_ZIZJJ|nr:protein NUCLEAR FUSION DEFECTIVE 6, mitochondrial isoform X1 [Ziziphus jujuba]